MSRGAIGNIEMGPNPQQPDRHPAGGHVPHCGAPNAFQSSIGPQTNSGAIEKISAHSPGGFLLYRKRLYLLLNNTSLL